MAGYFKVVVKGFTGRNAIELHINMIRWEGGGLEFITILNPSGYWFKVKDNGATEEEVKAIILEYIKRIFKQYEDDPTMIGYVDLPLGEFTVEVIKMNIPDEMVDEYIAVDKREKELSAEWNLILRKRADVLDAISKHG
jgi:hypothetical protein